MEGSSALALRVRALTYARHRRAALKTKAMRFSFPCQVETFEHALIKKRSELEGEAATVVAKTCDDGERKIFVFGHSVSSL